MLVRYYALHKMPCIVRYIDERSELLHMKYLSLEILFSINSLFPSNSNWRRRPIFLEHRAHFWCGGQVVAKRLMPISREIPRDSQNSQRAELIATQFIRTRYPGTRSSLSPPLPSADSALRPFFDVARRSFSFFSLPPSPVTLCSRRARFVGVAGLIAAQNENERGDERRRGGGGGARKCGRV